MDKIEELVRLAQNGDKDAETEIVNEGNKLVKTIARKYFILDGDVEDLGQCGMYGLFCAIKSFEPNGGASFKTYASKLIKNEILDAVKKSYIGSGKVFRETEIVDMDDFSGGDDPEKEVIDKQEYRNVYERLTRRLSGLEKAVIKYYLEGYRYKEIADKLNRTEKSIDSALLKAKNKIRKNYLKLKETE